MIKKTRGEKAMWGGRKMEACPWWAEELLFLLREVVQRGRARRPCWTSGGMGHRAQGCDIPERRVRAAGWSFWSRPAVCWECGRWGHLARRCPDTAVSWRAAREEEEVQRGESCGGGSEGEDEEEEWPEGDPDELVEEQVEPSCHTFFVLAAREEVAAAEKNAETALPKKKRKKKKRKRKSEEECGDADPVEGGASADVRCPQIDSQQLEQQIMAIMTEVIPFLKENMEEVCSYELLAGVRRMVLTLTQQSDESEEFVRFSNKQLGGRLQDSLSKFVGRSLEDCGEDLLVETSEILCNELAFFRFMQDLDKKAVN